RSKLIRFTPVLIFSVAVCQPILAERRFYFQVSVPDACRIAYGSNPFPESIRIAEYLPDHSNPSDTIAILGSEPQIYFYSGDTPPLVTSIPTRLWRRRATRDGCRKK